MNPPPHALHLLAAAASSLFAASDAADGGDGWWNQWIGAAVTLVVGFAIASAARWAIRRFGRRADSVTSTVQIMARLVFAALGAVTVYVALKTLGLDLGPVLAGAGIVGIALALSVQDLAENYISGTLMGFRNPFNPGDQIISGDFEGTVEELNLRYTTIRTYDGVKVMLPNATVLKNPLTNLTVNGRRRTDFSIGVAYGTDLRTARDTAIAAVSAADGVHDTPPPQAWVEELAASWITIRVRYWHEPRIADMWKVRNGAIIAVYEAMERDGIDLPFEHRVIELHSSGPAPGPNGPSDDVNRVEGAH